jgi:tRNA pseudouridine55 synthase
VTELPADFLLPVDKPEGPTSHDVVGTARKALGTKRIGHTGTLDPFASGLLILCVGKATRLAEYFTGMDKTYEAVARLGVRTDSLDREGRVVDETGAWSTLTPDGIAEAIASFVGEIDQVPPAFSAKKVGGERAYRRAREGVQVELEPCRVTIRSLDLTSTDLPKIGFRVTCSSGTYVRAIARDVGDALGVGAHLTDLRRTAIGGWSVEAALPADRLSDGDRVVEHAVSPLESLAHLPRVDVDDHVAGRLVLGQAVRLDEHPPSGAPLAVAHGGVLLAIGEADDGVLRPRKVFAA